MSLVAVPDEGALSEADARRLTERIHLMAGSIKESVEKLSALISEARRGSAHVALGYGSWTAYVAAEFADSPLRLDRDDRRELVVSLASQGMSSRAIAPVVGTSHTAVNNDLRAVGNKLPTETTGTDGKTYIRPEPDVVDAEIVEDEAGPPKVRRNPLPDQARSAGWELRKAVERLERIAADDRFNANKEQVAPHLRSHLTNAIEVCQDLLDRINN